MVSRKNDNDSDSGNQQVVALMQTVRELKAQIAALSSKESGSTDSGPHVNPLSQRPLSS